MAKQQDQHLYAQSWITLHQPDALVRETGEKIQWKGKNKDGKTDRERGFRVPPGSKVDPSKLDRHILENLTQIGKTMPALGPAPPEDRPRTQVFTAEMRIKSPGGK